MFRLTKRQRLEHPTSWMDIESIETVPYPHLSLRTASAVASMEEDGNQSKAESHGNNSAMVTPWIKTPVATMLTQEIFFDRFDKEIVQPFRFTLSSQLQLLHEDESIADVKHRRSVLRQRIRCGINEVSRSLEQAVAVAVTVADGSAAAATVPILIILTMSDRVNPTLMSHIPILAHQIGAPLLLLPGTSASTELGKLLGIRSVSALAIVSTSSTTTSENADTRLHQAVDSFANFMRGKV